MTFHNFFHDLLKVSMTLGLAVTLEYFQNFPLSTFWPNSVQQTQTMVSTKICVIHKYSPLSYVVLAVTSALFNLSNITFTFHDFPIYNSMTFQVFHDLYEPWIKYKPLKKHPSFITKFIYYFYSSLIPQAGYLVPRRLVLSPMNTDLISFPKLAAFTASNLLAWQCCK